MGKSANVCVQVREHKSPLHYRGIALHFRNWGSMDEPYLDFTTLRLQSRAHALLLSVCSPDVTWVFTIRPLQHVNFTRRKCSTARPLSFPNVKWTTASIFSTQCCNTVSDAKNKIAHLNIIFHSFQPVLLLTCPHSEIRYSDISVFCKRPLHNTLNITISFPVQLLS